MFGTIDETLALVLDLLPQKTKIPPAQKFRASFFIRGSKHLETEKHAAFGVLLSSVLNLLHLKLVVLDGIKMTDNRIATEVFLESKRSLYTRSITKGSLSNS